MTLNESEIKLNSYIQCFIANTLKVRYPKMPNFLCYDHHHIENSLMMLMSKFAKIISLLWLINMFLHSTTLKLTSFNSIKKSL